jgi:hypothetical protein
VFPPLDQEVAIVLTDEQAQARIKDTLALLHSARESLESADTALRRAATQAYGTSGMVDGRIIEIRGRIRHEVAAVTYEMGTWSEFSRDLEDTY